MPRASGRAGEDSGVGRWASPDTLISPSPTRPPSPARPSPLDLLSCARALICCRWVGVVAPRTCMSVCLSVCASFIYVTLVVAAHESAALTSPLYTLSLARCGFRLQSLFPGRSLSLSGASAVAHTAPHPHHIKYTPAPNVYMRLCCCFCQLDLRHPTLSSPSHKVCAARLTLFSPSGRDEYSVELNAFSRAYHHLY